jgi:hypothetical protein
MDNPVFPKVNPWFPVYVFPRKLIHNSNIYTFTYIYIHIHNIHYHTLLNYNSHRNLYLPQKKTRDGRSAGMVLQCLEVSTCPTGHIAG